MAHKSVLRALLCCSIALAGLLGNPLWGRAQASGAAAVAATNAADSNGAREEARRRFSRGLELARRLEWSAALAEFQASRELFPTRSATRNAAIALRQLGRYADATALYRLMLREFSGELPAEQAASIRQELVQVERLLGALELRATQIGAEVFVDGERRGATPLAEPVAVDPGAHTLRVTKIGFQALELKLSIASGQLKRVDVKLEAQLPAGELVVKETAGQTLEVVVDAASVGVTPWRGSLAPGLHSVLLRSATRWGTLPTAVRVTAGETTVLAVAAIRLDSSLRVESNAPGAAVFVDGVSVGFGGWSGHLPSGRHRVDVVAKYYRPFGQNLRLSPDQTALVRAKLERDAGADSEGHLYVVGTAGALLAASLHGGADDYCNCMERSRPKGGFAALSLGYAPYDGFGVELGAGYLTLAESMTRGLVAAGEAGQAPFHSRDYRDSTRISGPFFSLMGSYRLLKRTPLTARIGGGLALLRGTTTNEGTFTSTLRSSLHPGESVPYSGSASIQELEPRLLTPFGTTELRWGYRIAPRWVIDLGLAASVFFPPATKRAGATSYSSASSRIGVPESTGGQWADGTEARPGNLTLPAERLAGVFMGFSPSLGLRVDF